MAATAPVSVPEKVRTGAAGILAAVCAAHLMNDILQSLIPAIYPILKTTYRLDFSQIGLITLTTQLTASLLQPLVGLYTDHRPTYFALPAGMASSTAGLLLLARAPGFGAILIAVGLIGVGSAIFHPEASRIARMASGGRHGLAQSLFSLGGTGGQSLGPLLAAFIVQPKGQRSIAWFSAGALAAMGLLARVSAWYKAQSLARIAQRTAARRRPAASGRRVRWAMTILIVLTFSKFFYLAGLVNYYTFFLIGKFHVSVENAQIHLFVFLAAAATGGLAGGPLGDRIGRKYIIWGSILGVLPFTLALPYANLFWTGVLSVVIGLVLASAFSAILVYAQDLVPGKVGTISGLFFGLAFGMGGVGAAVLGELADLTSIDFVYRVCAFLPAIGLLAVFLPSISPAEARAEP
ncbi:MAG TPA: MFS transporter [Candidatus Sulfopaludibacter sp.]|nr:MFS transporter [Candidatus Sulfopaludibacter sp.]